MPLPFARRAQQAVQLLDHHQYDSNDDIRVRIQIYQHLRSCARRDLALVEEHAPICRPVGLALTGHFDFALTEILGKYTHLVV